MPWHSITEVYSSANLKCYEFLPSVRYVEMYNNAMFHHFISYSSSKFNKNPITIKLWLPINYCQVSTTSIGLLEFRSEWCWFWAPEAVHLVRPMPENPRSSPPLSRMPLWWKLKYKYRTYIRTVYCLVWIWSDGVVLWYWMWSTLGAAPHVTAHNVDQNLRPGDWTRASKLELMNKWFISFFKYIYKQT